MPFSCLIINLLTLILKGAKDKGERERERDCASAREQKLPEAKSALSPLGVQEEPDTGCTA